MTETKGLYRFKLDCGRSGDLEGVFIATEQQISDAVGKLAYFGEVLGKHSEVMCHLNRGHMRLLTTDCLAIQVVEKFQLESGFNPLEYIEEEDLETEDIEGND